jgi:hypothetical protein
MVVAIAAAILLGGSAITADEPACRAERSCDCEATGGEPFRQPAGAWSSLTLVAAGAWSATRGRRVSYKTLGTALAATGAAAFSYHATLAGWASRLDEAAIVVLVAVLAAHRWQHTIAFPAGASVAVLAASAMTAAGMGGPGLGAAVVLSIAGHLRSRRFGRPAIGLAAAATLAVGALLWWAGGSERSWCQPDSWLQPHAAWHAAAALAGILAIAYLRSCEDAGSLYSAPGDAHHEGR